MRYTSTALCVSRYRNNAKCYNRVLPFGLVVEAYASNQVVRR